MSDDRNDLRQYLDSIASLCESGPAICGVLAEAGLTSASRPWAAYSQDAVAFGVEMIKEGSAGFSVGGSFIGYESPLVKEVTSANGISKADIWNPSRSLACEERIAADPRMAMFTRDALTVATGGDETIAGRRRESEAIGRGRMMAELGLHEGMASESLTFGEAVDCISRQFASLGIKARKVRSGSSVMEYQDPSMLGVAAFHLKLSSMPGFEYYFSCDIAVGLSRDLSIAMHGEAVVIKAKHSPVSLRSLIRGVGPYTSSITKDDLLNSLYAHVKVIPLVVSHFRKEC